MPVREDTLEGWSLAIEDGLEFRRLYGRESEWAKVEALFYQSHDMQKDSVGPNIISATGDSLLSSLLVPEPFYNIKPLRMDVVESTPILESVLNSLRCSMGVKQEVEAAILHAYLYSQGILKIGYDSEFGYDPATDIGASQKLFLGLGLSQFDKKGSKIEYNALVKPGMPWVEAVLPHDFVVPRGTFKLHKAPWCAHRIIRHIDDVKADPKYSNKKDLQPTMSMADWVDSYLRVFKPYRMGKAQWSNTARGFSEKAEYVEMWEIHDARTHRIKVIATGYDELIRDDIDYLQISGLPFVNISLVPRSRCFWTTPDAVYLLNQQEEALDIAQMQRTQRRLSTLRFGYEEGSLDNDELTKLHSGQIGAMVKFKQGLGEKAFMPMTPSNNNNQLQSEAEAIRRDARETVGMGRNQLGELSPGRHSANEAVIANQASEQRMNRREDALAVLYEQLGEKLARVIFGFWKTPRMVQIMGQTGAAQWTSFTGTQLKGDYTYEVGFSSEPVETKQGRVNKALQFYQVLIQDPTVDPIALRQYLIRAINEPEFTAIFKPGVALHANLPVQLPQESPVGGQQPQGNQQRGGQGALSKVPQAGGATVQ